MARGYEGGQKGGGDRCNRGVTEIPGCLYRRGDTGGFYWKVAARHVPVGLRGKSDPCYLPLVDGGRYATRNRRDAERIRRGWWRQWHGEQLARPESLSLDRWVSAFAEWNLATASARQSAYNARIARMFIVAQGLLRPWDIEIEHVEAYLADLRAAGRSDRTVVAHRNALRKFARFLVRRRVLESNPVDMVDVRQPILAPPRFLEDAALAGLLRRARQNAPGWLCEAIRLAASEGPRLGEIVSLRRQDVLPAGLLFARTKTRDFRMVPIFPGVRGMIRRWRRGKPGDLVFPKHHTRTWGYMLADMTDGLEPFGQAGGVGNQWHLLRSTFAVNRARRGATLWEIMSWLGHRNPMTTMRYVSIARAAGGRR